MKWSGARRDQPPKASTNGEKAFNPSVGGGVAINLNRIEPTVASKALVNTGIRKYYLTYNATQRTGRFSGLTHAFGLRMEF